MDPTPLPTSPPVSASCGLCVEDNSIKCTINADCPTVPSPSPGTCASPNGAPTDDNECVGDGQCEPSKGNPANRGTCVVGDPVLVETECDLTLCPLTNAPTPVPTNAPTDVVSEDYLMLMKQSIVSIVGYEICDLRREDHSWNFA